MNKNEEMLGGKHWKIIRKDEHIPSECSPTHPEIHAIQKGDDLLVSRKLFETLSLGNDTKELRAQLYAINQAVGCKEGVETAQAVNSVVSQLADANEKIRVLISKRNEFVVSTNINDYRPIFEGLAEDFDYKHWHSILVKCGVIECSFNRRNKFKEVWLIKMDDMVIGMCGLYSHNYVTNELWLAWFGILPEYRKLGFGKKAINFMSVMARELGCKKLMSYVDSKGGPMPFYYKCGFSLYGTVSDYVNEHPELSVGQEFENPMDLIIWKDL